MPVDPVRDAAIDVLLRVFDRDAYISASIDRKFQRRAMSPRGKRFMTQLVYGTVRHALLCDHALTGLVRQPLDELPTAIRYILRMGVFQSLFCNQVTFPAMVHTSVELAKKRGHAGTARLVNAVLNRAPQRIADITLPNPESDRHGYISVRYSIPRWLVDRWAAQFGGDTAEALAIACSEEAPVTLRVNTIKTTRDALAEVLAKAGCTVDAARPIPDEIAYLEGPPPAQLRAFQEGLFFIQDGASMLPSHLLAPKAGERVLDLCAAPGGKSTHIAALQQDGGAVFAMEKHPGKVHLIAENAERLGLASIRPVCGDGLMPPVRGPFAKVLADAPCSSLGTLRRHPELKWRMTEADIRANQRLQTALLRQAVELCENKGVIVYSVCTFTAEETDAVIETVMGDGRVAREDGPSWLDPWKTKPGTYRTLPSLHGLDGFFLTRLRKRS